MGANKEPGLSVTYKDPLRPLSWAMVSQRRRAKSHTYSSAPLQRPQKPEADPSARSSWTSSAFATAARQLALPFQGSSSWYVDMLAGLGFDRTAALDVLDEVLRRRAWGNVSAHHQAVVGAFSVGAWVQIDGISGFINRRKAPLRVSRSPTSYLLSSPTESLSPSRPAS